MGIKLYGHLWTLVITAFSYHFGDRLREELLFLSFLLAERGNLCKSELQKLLKSRLVSSQFIYGFCRNLMDTMTGSSYSNFSRMFSCPEGSK